MKLRKVLVIYKRSVFEKIFKGRPILKKRMNPPDIAAHIKRTLQVHHYHYASLKKVLDSLTDRGIAFHAVDRHTRVDLKGYDVIFTVGGDGTFLEAAQQVRKQILVGINSAPDYSIGRYCSTNADRFGDFLAALTEDRLKPRVFHRLSLKLNQRVVVPCILNDILIAHVNPAIMSRYIIQIGARKEIQRSSGIWISSSSGSTGAIQSAGGVVVPPDRRAIVYLVREYHEEMNRVCSLKGGVLKKGQTLKLLCMMQEGKIYIDGSQGILPFPYASSAEIGFSEFPLHTFEKVA